MKSELSGRISTTIVDGFHSSRPSENEASFGRVEPTRARTLDRRISSPAWKNGIPCDSPTTAVARWFMRHRSASDASGDACDVTTAAVTLPSARARATIQSLFTAAPNAYYRPAKLEAQFTDVVIFH